MKTGLELGADHVVNVTNEDPVEAVRRLNGGKGVDYVLECSGAPNAINEAVRMVNRGGKICLAAFPHEPVPVDIAHIVRNNIYLYGIRGEGKSATHRAEAFMRQKRFDATKIHTHTFALEDLPTALALRQGPRGKRHQGGGEGEGRRRSQGGRIAAPAGAPKPAGKPQRREDLPSRPQMPGQAAFALSTFTPAPSVSITLLSSLTQA